MSAAAAAGVALGAAGWVVVFAAAGALAVRRSAAERARRQRKFLARIRNNTPPDWRP